MISSSSSLVTPAGSVPQVMTSSSVIADQPRTTRRLCGVSAISSPSGSSTKMRSESTPRTSS